MSSKENGTGVSVAIVGGTISGNRGAEAMLATTIGEIKKRIDRPVRFSVFSYYPKEDSRLCRDPDIQLLDYRPLSLALYIVPLCLLLALLRRVGLDLPESLLPRPVGAMANADVLFDVGGITFCDGREVFLLYNVLSILPALALGVPVVKLSQAMGPFRNPLNRLLASAILPRCRRIFARGRTTEAHLQDLELPESLYSPASDIAFSFCPEYSLSSECPSEAAELIESLEDVRGRGIPLIALVPSGLLAKNDTSYTTRLAAMVVHQLRCGRAVVLVPNATRSGSRKHRNNDLVAIAAIEQHVRASAKANQLLFAVACDVNTNCIRALLRLADVVLSSRFHGMVAGLALGLPVVVIGWSHKYQEVLAEFGLDSYSLDYADDSRSIDSLVDEAFEKREELSGRVRSHLGMVVKSSQSQFEQSAALLP